MNGMKLTFVCTLIVLLGTSFLPVHAQVPEAVPAPKQNPSPTTRRG